MDKKKQAYKTIKELVKRFSEHIDEYKRGSYSETQTRVDYIDPFFKALGWDMYNKQGLAEAYREVIHEYKMKVDGATKAPDYCFTVYGQRKFFVDAKKPSINVKGDVAPAYQVRRYGWSAKLLIAIVTDFEEFSIYDCSKKPKQNDRSSVERIRYLTYDKYLDEFDFIYGTFAKESILKGSFDKFVQSDTKKKGTATVDDEFLRSIEEWRTYLASTIALRNKKLSEDEINYAVQKTIDRIIFLRICEDRGIEQYGELKNSLNDGTFYESLFKLYHNADEKYNSGLFDFKEDTITPKLKIDNKAIKKIINELYYPESPYEFSVLPADILGSVYERFLGKTIRLTKAHHAKIEEKPEVRKAGGVYYTPKYIVDYIVENTVGKLLKGKKPKDVGKLKIVDPACGSGSFLIGAYRYLLDWHLQYYIKNPPQKAKDNPLSPDGNLTTAEKKRILLNNIFGVDIDAQAVEVTKLNLLLKALEGETKASIDKQLTFFNERVLPNLGDNIKCGNSLIGTDFYDEQPGLFADNIKKINAFDWDKAFPEVFKNGGFDAVIGNPPYFSISTLDKDYYAYLEKKYCEIHTGYNDIMYYFIYKGIKILNINGFYGVITSNYYLGNSYSKPLRKYLKKYIIKILNFKDFQVFKKANIHTNIIIARRNTYSNKIDFYQDKIECVMDFVDLESNYNHFTLKREELTEDWLIAENKKLRLFKKVGKNCSLLGDLCIIKKGATSGNRKIFTIPNKLAKKNHFEKDIIRKSINSRDIGKYFLKDSGKYLIYVDNKTEVKKFPHVYKYLLSHKSELSKRNEVRQGLYPWYRLERPREKYIFDSKEKLVVPYRAKKNSFAFDNQRCFNDGGGSYAIILKDERKLDLKYILGILNSKLMNWYYGFIGKPKGEMREYFNIPMSKITIHKIDLLNSIEKNAHDSIVNLVDNLLHLNKDLHAATLTTQRQRIQRAIDHAERKIDELVYELYGLSEEEVRIVEGEL